MIAREGRSPRWRTIVAKLEAWFGTLDGLRTIELGSGRGDLSALLAQRGARVTLLDTSDRALAQARHRFDRMSLKAEFVQADMLGGLDPASEPFDVALSSGVIEHFTNQNRTRAVRAHYDMLRRGGAAIISVPHAWCIPYRLWKTYLELRGCWPYGLEIPYSRPELARRSRQAGFEEVELRCMGFWQSVGDHWGKSVLGMKVDWVDRPCVLDGGMGLVLLLCGRRLS